MEGGNLVLGMNKYDSLSSSSHKLACEIITNTDGRLTIIFAWPIFIEKIQQHLLNFIPRSLISPMN